MHIPRRYTAATAAVGLAAATLFAAPTASAHQSTSRHGHHHPPGASRVLATGLLSPLRAAVTHHGTVYVSENFAGKIDRVTRHGHRSTIYTDSSHNEVGGLSLDGRKLYFTVTQSSGSEGAPSTGSWLKVRTPSGHVRTVADVHAFEAAHNPDKINTYGIVNASALDPACAAKWPTAQNGPISYTGAIDSHPYSTTPGAHGTVYIADAAANAVFLVSRGGHLRTVSVLPPIPFKITAGAAAGMGLDPCFVGQTYNFEPVPTDIERTHSGRLFVTSLPGGPPGPQLGGRGSVFTINGNDSHHGHKHGHNGHGSLVRPHRVVTGLVEPTGLAITPRGDLFVAQLFGNVISRVTLSRHGGHVTDSIRTTNPGEVEWAPSGLYYTANVLSGTPEGPGGSTTPAGKLVRVSSGHHHH